jgi:hypothetical protein
MIIIIIYNKMNDISITNNKILNSIVNKVKKLRNSFNKSKNKLCSDTYYNKKLNRTLSELSIDTNKSHSSSIKTYSKTNSSNYSKRDRSLDLIRVEIDDYDNNSSSKDNIDYNHEIVLPYQRYAYNKLRN